jgi:hypothetical protein
MVFNAGKVRGSFAVWLPVWLLVWLPIWPLAGTRSADQMNNPTIMAKLFFIISSPENQPRRNEGNEGRSEKTFVLFVSSWLIS